MLCSLHSPASIIIAEIVLKVLLLPVPVIIFSLSLGLMPTISANLFVKDVLFDWDSSLIYSGVLPVISLQLHIGENSINFTSCTSVLGIGVEYVVFFSTSPILYSGVSRSTSAAGAIFRFSCFSSAASFFSCCSFLLIMVTDTFLF